MAIASAPSMIEPAAMLGPGTGVPLSAHMNCILVALIWELFGQVVSIADLSTHISMFTLLV